MTMIMMHDRFMACDSRVISGSLIVSDRCKPRKITRAVDGSLIGVMGSIVHGYSVLAWAKLSMDFDQFPKFHFASDEDPTEYMFALMRPDGTKYLGDAVGQLHQCDAPEFLGGSQSVAYAFGVFDALSQLNHNPRQLVMRVMHMVAERNPNVGGQIHIFDLDHPELDP